MDDLDRAAGHRLHLVLALAIALSSAGLASPLEAAPAAGPQGQDLLELQATVPPPSPAPAVDRAPAQGAPDPLEGLQWNLEAINASPRDPVPGPLPVLAILDSGIDLAHLDLAGQLWQGNPDHGVNLAQPVGHAAGLPVGAQTTMQDSQGHGTHAAGVAVATPANGAGIRGIAPTPLMVVKLTGLAAPATTGALAEGLAWAAEHGARVASVSLTTYGDDPELREAIALAEGSGMVVVAAAGNTGTAARLYPAAYPTVLSIGALDRGLAPAAFSSTGKVDLAAPGLEVPTTHLANTYALASGTSIAAPQVAAAAALLIAQDPSLTPAEVRTLLNTTARDVHADGIDAATGHGLLDIGAALAAIRG